MVQPLPCGLGGKKAKGATPQQKKHPLGRPIPRLEVSKTDYRNTEKYNYHLRIGRRRTFN
jgi:hypothetical protein